MIDQIRRAGLYDKIWQAFAVLSRRGRSSGSDGMEQTSH
jgi:GMP synthase PP-ATPase subunit